jgi:hypothetical protein
VTENTHVAFKALAILIAIQRVKEESPELAEGMLATTWKELEKELRRGARESDNMSNFTAWPGTLALSHYFYYGGDLKKGIERLKQQLILRGLYTDESARDVEVMANGAYQDSKRYTR